ncbi:hypothetical protein VPHD479_0115 [Vibrio phage D479]
MSNPANVRVRVIEKNGKFRVQQKGWFFWTDLNADGTKNTRGEYHTYSLEDANAIMHKVASNQVDTKWKVKTDTDDWGIR